MRWRIEVKRSVHFAPPCSTWRLLSDGVTETSEVFSFEVAVRVIGEGHPATAFVSAIFAGTSDRVLITPYRPSTETNEDGWRRVEFAGDTTGEVEGERRCEW